jgi:hypothetical protein
MSSNPEWRRDIPSAGSYEGYKRIVPGLVAIAYSGHKEGRSFWRIIDPVR